METLEQLSETLASIDDLRSIVRTMRALAAASIRQYERAVESLNQYNRTIELRYLAGRSRSRVRAPVLQPPAFRSTYVADGAAALACGSPSLPSAGGGPVALTCSADLQHGSARLFAALVRQYLFVSLFRACAESQAEHASRLNAMRSTSRNLDDRQTELVGEFRRRRQAVITAELLDVVSGYEALNTPAERVGAPEQ